MANLQAASDPKDNVDDSESIASDESEEMIGTKLIKRFNRHKARLIVFI